MVNQSDERKFSSENPKHRKQMVEGSWLDWQVWKMSLFGVCQFVDTSIITGGKTDQWPYSLCSLGFYIASWPEADMGKVASDLVH